MARKHKSRAWAARQNRDPFVRHARRDGWRARAVFKLQEIDRKHRLIQPGMTVVDLGAAPGSWSQYAAAKIKLDGDGDGDGDSDSDGNGNGDGGNAGRIIAVDKLDMRAIDGIDFIRGDFTDDATVAQVAAALAGPADLVLSDLSPDLSGIRIRDQARAEALHDAVLAFCARALRPGGALLAKAFAGESAPAMRARLDAEFDAVRALKPAASRAQSREVYHLALGFFGGGDGDRDGDGGDSGGDARPGAAADALYSARNESPLR